MLRICKSHSLQRLLSRWLKSCQFRLNRLFFCEDHWKTKNIKRVVFWVKTPDIKQFVTENTEHQDLQMETINLSSIDHLQNEEQKLWRSGYDKNSFQMQTHFTAKCYSQPKCIFSLQFSNIKNTYFNSFPLYFALFCVL